VTFLLGRRLRTTSIWSFRIEILLAQFTYLLSAKGNKKHPIGMETFLTARGANVKVTIFGDFRQFSATKLTFFLKTNVTI
jgi:hypothetical protein